MYGCKACLRVIETGNRIFYLSDIYMNPLSSSSDAISIKDKLAECVPELMLDTEDNAMMCKPCVSSLMAAYDFRRQCLEVQHKIHGYLQQMPIKTEIDIGQIAMYYKSQEVLAKGGNPLIGAVDGSNNEYVLLTPKNELNMSYDIETDNSSLPSNLYQSMTEESLKQELAKTTKASNKKTHPKSDFNCNTCNFKCNTEYLLKRHKRIHNEKYCVECSQCQFRCKTPFDLKAHTKTKHKRYAHSSSFNVEYEVNSIVGQKNVGQEKNKDSRGAKKRMRIKEQKRLVAQMPPVLVITPR